MRTLYLLIPYPFDIMHYHKSMIDILWKHNENMLDTLMLLAKEKEDSN